MCNCGHNHGHGPELGVALPGEPAPRDWTNPYTLGFYVLEHLSAQRGGAKPETFINSVTLDEMKAAMRAVMEKAIADGAADAPLPEEIDPIIAYHTS